MVLASALGAAELTRARTDARRGTGVVAAGLAVGAAIVAAAWLSAGAFSPLVLLSLAVALAAMDVLTEDAALAWASRCGSTVAWCAAVGVILVRSVESPEGSVVPWLLAAASAVLVALLRRQAWPAFLAGLCASAALAAGCLSLGLLPLEHPALFLAPAGAWIVACGAVESGRGRAANVLLACGLVPLAAGVLLEAHVDGAPPMLRWSAVALGAAMLACGVLSRHRAPVVVGAVTLGVEGALLARDAVVLVVEHPLPGLAAVAAACALAAAAAWRLAWRAGGRAALEMAWASDIVRLRESWSRWI